MFGPTRRSCADGPQCSRPARTQEVVTIAPPTMPERERKTPVSAQGKAVPPISTPDAGFYLAGIETRLIVDDDKPIPFAPDLAVEVTAPSQDAEDPAAKVRIYSAGRHPPCVGRLATGPAYRGCLACGQARSSYGNPQRRRYPWGRGVAPRLYLSGGRGLRRPSRLRRVVHSVMVRRGRERSSSGP